MKKAFMFQLTAIITAVLFFLYPFYSVYAFAAQEGGSINTAVSQYHSSDDKNNNAEFASTYNLAYSITRISGKGRCETAIKAADTLKEKLGVDEFNSIIIASGDNFADALAGSYLAAQKGAPILLYQASSVDLNKSYILENLKSGGTVYLLGGTAAVPADVEEGLKKAGITVQRLSGKTRFETNLEILEEAGVEKGQEILVCTGYNFADSLSASATGLPILMVDSNKNVLTDAQKQFLSGLSDSDITIISGSGAVSDTLMTALQDYGSVTRLSGKTRYETSTLIAKTYFGAVDTVVIAYGNNFPDGLCGGPLAYAMGAPLVLTAAKSETAAAEYVAEKHVSEGFIMGGTGVLSDETVHQIFKDVTPSFYRVSGQEILNPDGDPVVLHGMHFNNGVYSTPDSIDDLVITADHTAASYYELAEMGLDHVRFAFNYHLFEDDSAPYTYKEDGFALIDQNLAWAKAAGIDLILQLKWPQGGLQMETDEMLPSAEGVGNGGKGLWLDIDPDTGAILDTENYKENQARLVALWTEIARRYANEPAIIGYNLFNEPVIPRLGTKEATVAQVQDLMQRIADGIRTVDTNHILFVERPVGWFAVGDQTQTDDTPLSISDTQYLIDDDNTVYEFHFYEPFTFTHQGADWLPQYPEGVYYPSRVPMSYDVESWTPIASIPSSATTTAEDGWTYFLSEPFTAGTNSTGQPYNLATLQVAAYHLAAGGAVWFDDLAVTRTDSDGATTTVCSYDFTDGPGQFQLDQLWDQNGTGAAVWDTTVGHNDSGSLCLTESVGDNLMDIGSSDWFYMEEGCSYQISGWVKGSNGGQYPQVNAIYAENVQMADRSYVESMLQQYVAFRENNDVPLYVGEWGLHYKSLPYGSEDYIRDVAQLLEQYGLSSSYYAYHDDCFALYVCDEQTAPSQRNEELYSLLVKWYGRSELSR